MPREDLVTLLSAWFLVGAWAGFLVGVFLAPRLWRKTEATS